MPDVPHAGEERRACTNCSRSKAKCVWPSAADGSEPHICQRCSSNGLECSRSEPQAKRKRGKATHAKVLERKLDDIMLLLNRERDLSAQNSQASDSQSSPLVGLASHSQGEEDPNVSFNTPPTIIDPSTEAITIIPGYQVTLQEAELIFQIYTSDFVPQFPFVPLPNDKARDLSVGFERWFRQYVAYRVVVLLEKNLEILQALLVYFAWNDILYYARSSDTSLMQLARGLAEDLGLTKRPGIPVSPSGSIYEDAAFLSKDIQVRNQHTNAGRRAVLGLFHMSSVLSGLLGRSSWLEFTRYFDDCCEKLANAQEYSTDLLLVQLIGARKVALRVDDTFREQSELANDQPFGGPHALAIATVEKELDSFMDSLPAPLRSNYLLREQSAAIRIRLFEPAIHVQGSTRPQIPHLGSRMMWQCLTSIQELLNAFLALPVETYASLTFISILHLALAIIKACGLLCMKDRDWDLETARASLSLADTLQILSERFDAATRIDAAGCASLVNRQPLLSSYAENYRAIRRWFLSKVGPTGATSTMPTMMDPVFAEGVGVPEGFEFWQQLSELTYGALPNT
ncbi:fungal transcriptional regulatory protein [Colletotrichum chrysophilum]|uniref:Fungal transcriptional regulatory protein n=1 Tax=Colletotrichum chrysophilum TaxID=1836956 RepID=A0AAD9ACE5_9PEZI|nr:fungal transcriptional regulatory protein [Colletotrichum chrysophilum]